MFADGEDVLVVEVSSPELTTSSAPRGSLRARRDDSAMKRSYPASLALLALLLGSVPRLATAADPQPTPTPGATAKGKKKLGGGASAYRQSRPRRRGQAPAPLADIARKAQEDEAAAAAGTSNRHHERKPAPVAEPAQGSSTITITGSADKKPVARTMPHGGPVRDSGVPRRQRPNRGRVEKASRGSALPGGGRGDGDRRGESGSPQARERLLRLERRQLPRTCHPSGLGPGAGEAEEPRGRGRRGPERSRRTGRRGPKERDATRWLR